MMQYLNRFHFLMVQEGWSLAELFNVRCVVAAPYVVPYRYWGLPFNNISL